VRLALYDILGREVATLREGQFTFGFYEQQFPLASLLTGYYSIVLIADGTRLHRSFAIIK